MKTDRIEKLIVELSENPFNPELNFKVAEEYAAHNQLASAVSFYLRCMEYGYGSHPLHVYTSLLKLANCFETQKDRQWTVSGAILQAVSYLPDRPEAWFYLSRFYERKGEWQESYTYAQVGLSVGHSAPPLPSSTDYPGDYALNFQKGVAAWWIGRKNESKDIFEMLLRLNISDEYRSSINYNLERLG